MQKNRWWTVFQNSNIDFVIDWYRWSINRHGSHLFREILDGGINSPWSEQFTIEIVSTKVYIRVVEYFLCANFDPSLFISSKVSYCRIASPRFIHYSIRGSNSTNFLRGNPIETISSLSRRGQQVPFVLVTLGKVGHLLLGHTIENQFPRRITPALSIMRGTRSRSR